MYTIIIGAILGAILIARTFGEYEYGLVKFFYCLIGGILGTMLGGLFGALFAMGFSAANALADGYTPKTTELNIVALQDNPTTNGHFFLGSGYVEGGMNYYYMVKDSSGSMAMGDSKIDQSILREDIKFDTITKSYSKNPFVEIISYEPSTWFIRNFGCECGFKDNKYIFHIPANSVINGFKVDME